MSDQGFQERKQKALTQLSEYTPEKIYEQLDKTVIGCEAAKKALSVFGFRQKRKMTGMHYSHSPSTSLLLQGGTGCGKTYIVSQLAKILGLPFIHVDCASLTSEGYIGNSIRDSLLPLNNMPNGQFAVVFLDEFDKLGTGYDAGSSNGGAGITTTKVQMELLRIIEGKALDTDARGSGSNDFAIDQAAVTTALAAYQLERQDYENIFIDRINQVLERCVTLRPAESINTSNILFIFGGRFEGLDLNSREEEKTLGFALAPKKETEMRAHFAKKLVEFGIMPELVGRISQILPVPNMTKEVLTQILEVKDGALDRFKRMFIEHGAQVILEPCAKDFIIETALSFDLGARPLLSILDGLFTHIEYKLLNDVFNDLIGVLRIDAETVKRILNDAK